MYKYVFVFCYCIMNGFGKYNNKTAFDASYKLDTIITRYYFKYD